MSIEKAIKQKKFVNPYQKLVINIAYTNAYINDLVHQKLKPFSLSTEQYNVLRILRGQHPTPVSILAITERMINKMSNASRLVEKLRLKDLVERTVSVDDKRRVDVNITEKGLAVLKELDEIMIDFANQFGPLTVEEINTLNELLDKLRYPNE